MAGTVSANGGTEGAEIPPEAPGSLELGNRFTLPNGRGRRAAPARVSQGSFSRGGPAVQLLDGFREHLDLLVQLLHVGAEPGAPLGAPAGDAAEAASEALARSSAELTRTLFGSQPLSRQSSHSLRRYADQNTLDPWTPIDECGSDADDATNAPVADDSAQGAQEAKKVSFTDSEPTSEDDAGASGSAADPSSTGPTPPSRLSRLMGAFSDGSSEKALSLANYEKQCTKAKMSVPAQRSSVASLSHIPGTCNMRWCCQQVIASTCFEWLVAAVILSNAVFVGVQADWGVHHPGEEIPLRYRAIDSSLIAFFTIELILRIVAEGCAFLSRKNPEVRWNVFDSALVAIAYWELMTTSLGVSVSFIKTNITRLLRLSRLVRAMRVIRIIRFFSELRVMVLAIGSSLKLLLWASCLLAMLIYLFAVSFVQVVENELASNVEDAGGVRMYDVDELRAYWGSLPQALYTLYMSITNGMSWNIAAEPLLKISPLLAGAYCLYIAISLFCVLNTITGIFCEKAIQIAAADEDCMMWNELDRRKRWVRDVKRIFRAADGGHTGNLEWEGFCSLLDDIHMQNILKSLGVDVTAVEPRMLFDLFDADGGGTIEINEFAAALQKLHGSAKAVDMARMKYKLMGMNKRIKDIKEMLESQGFGHSSPRRLRSTDVPTWSSERTDLTDDSVW